MISNVQDVFKCNYSCPREFSSEDLGKLELENKLERLSDKYALLKNDPLFENENGFRRIVSLQDSKNSKKGLVGGYVDKNTYLDINGDWWIEYSSSVCNCVIKDNAVIGICCSVEYSKIIENACIECESKVLYSMLAGNVAVKNYCNVYSSNLYGSTEISDYCKIEHSTISDNIKKVSNCNLEKQKAESCKISNFVNINNSTICNGVNIDNHVSVIECTIKGNNINISNYAKLINCNIFNPNSVITGSRNMEDNTVIIDCNIHERHLLETTGVLYNKDL